jgi:L-malate glycosyltransferase
MLGTALSLPDKQTSESLGWLTSQQNDRVSVCHVIDGGAWAGAEAQVATLLRALSTCPQVSLHAIVLHEGRLAQKLRTFGVTVRVVEQQRSFGQVIAECSKFLEGRNIKILHSHNYKENLIAVLLSRICNVPHLVRTEHGHPEPYSAFRNLKHWGVLAADRLAARYTAAQIVSVSSDLGAFWKRHADPTNVTILPNGVDLDSVSSSFSPREAKQRLGMPSDSFVVGIAARLEYIKRHDLFLATARYLAGNIPSSQFVIAGSGRQEESLRRLILESGLQNRVALLGDRHDVYDVLRAMDILLICSDHEGIPMVMLEAMALGVAVVSRNVGGISEVIRNGINGILVPSDNPEELGRACMSIFQDPMLLADLRLAAHDQIQRHHSADKNAQTIVELYQSICRRPVR